MNSFVKISALALSGALVGISAQAQTLDNASAEVYGVVLPVVNFKSTATAASTGLTRAEVTAELQRARANGELDFASAEINGVVPQRGSVSASDLRLARRNATAQ